MASVIVSNQVAANPDAAIAAVIGQARSVLGRPYIWAGTFEGGKGGDCSGLVVYSFKHGANISLPHFTGFLINQGVEVTRAQLQPGDLVFPDFHHVQIYTGGGNIIEAPQSGEVVKERPMWGFWRARRIITGGSGNVTAPQGFKVPGLPSASDVLTPASMIAELTQRWAESARGILLRVAEGVIGVMLIVAGAAELGLTGPAVKSFVKVGAKL